MPRSQSNSRHCEEAKEHKHDNRIPALERTTSGVDWDGVRGLNVLIQPLVRPKACCCQNTKWIFQSLALMYREQRGSVVECLTRDRGAAGSSLTCVTVLCP